MDHRHRNGDPTTTANPRHGDRTHVMTHDGAKPNVGATEADHEAEAETEIVTTGGTRDVEIGMKAETVAKAIDRSDGFQTESSTDMQQTELVGTSGVKIDQAKVARLAKTATRDKAKGTWEQAEIETTSVVGTNPDLDQGRHLEIKVGTHHHHRARTGGARARTRATSHSAALPLGAAPSRQRQTRSAMVPPNGPSADSVKSTRKRHMPTLCRATRMQVTHHLNPTCGIHRASSHLR